MCDVGRAKIDRFFTWRKRDNAIVIAVWFRVSSEPFPHGTNEMFALHETLIIEKAMLAMVRVSVKTLRRN